VGQAAKRVVLETAAKLEVVSGWQTEKVLLLAVWLAAGLKVLGFPQA
jgi:hypothetical protein